MIYAREGRRILTKSQIDEIAYRVIGCGFEVHNTLGTGFQEVIYQRALSAEMLKRGIEHQREVEYTVTYKGSQVGSRRADFIVFDNILVEIKAVSELLPVHLAQSLNYVEAYNLPIGLLLNFGTDTMGIRRVTNNKYIL